MFLKKTVVFWVTSSWLCCGFPLSIQAETVLEKIQRTGLLKIALREDAPPFGYLNTNQNLQGYCLDFFALLEKQLINTLNRQTLSIKLLKSNTSNRFELVSNNIVDLECGPNTIRAEAPENTAFSQGFFVTGTQFLVRENNGDRFNWQSNLNEIKLGVVRNTTTEEFITTTYPLAQIYRFSGVTAKARGIQAVMQGKIDGMVSDGILLRAEAQQLGLSVARYRLIPELPLTKDPYGMILQGDDPQWQDFVNSVINSPEADALSQVWFGRLFREQYPQEKN